jgi:hypothetical protein
LDKTNFGTLIKTDNKTEPIKQLPHYSEAIKHPKENPCHSIPTYKHTLGKEETEKKTRKNSATFAVIILLANKQLHSIITCHYYNKSFLVVVIVVVVNEYMNYNKT